VRRAVSEIRRDVVERKQSSASRERRERSVREERVNGVWEMGRRTSERVIEVDEDWE
jgi:hypothetical protein